MILIFPGLALVTLRWRWQKHFCNTYGTHSCAIWSRCLGFEPPGHRRWFAMELIIIDLGKSSLHCLMLCHLNSLYHMSEYVWRGNCTYSVWLLEVVWKWSERPHIYFPLWCVLDIPFGFCFVQWICQEEQSQQHDGCTHCPLPITVW